MNGRVYDPWLGQFLSADPVDGDVYRSQRLGRYSYVMNSPHGYTDPTGFDDTCIGKGGGHNADCHREMDEIIVTASRTAEQTAAWDGNNVTVTARQNSWPQDEVQAFFERVGTYGDAAYHVLVNRDWTFSAMAAAGAGANIDIGLNDAASYIDFIALGIGGGVSVDTTLFSRTYGDSTGPVRVVMGFDGRFHYFGGFRVSLMYMAPSAVHFSIGAGPGFSAGFNFYSVGYQVSD